MGDCFCDDCVPLSEAESVVETALTALTAVAAAGVEMTPNEVEFSIGKVAVRSMMSQATLTHVHSV